VYHGVRPLSNPRNAGAQIGDIALRYNLTFRRAR